MKTIKNLNSTNHVEQKNINTKVNDELAKIFGIDNTKDSVHSILNTNNSSNNKKIEVNSMEAQLAEMFGKYDEMIELSNQPISLASVMHEYDEYEKRLAA